MRPRWVRVRERHHLRRLRAQELRVRAVSMPVRFVRVPIEKLIERGVGRVEFFFVAFRSRRSAFVRSPSSRDGEGECERAIGALTDASNHLRPADDARRARRRDFVCFRSTPS